MSTRPAPTKRSSLPTQPMSLRARMSCHQAHDVAFEHAAQASVGTPLCSVLHFYARSFSDWQTMSTPQPFLHLLLNPFHRLHANRQTYQAVCDALPLFLGGADVAV